MPLVRAVASVGDVELDWHVAADRGAVWRALTEPAMLRQWLGTVLALDVRAGGRIAVDHGGGYVCESEVRRVTPRERLAMSWRFPDEHPTELAVELADVPAPGGEVTACGLVLRHTGLGDLAAGYRLGWVVHLTYLEAAVAGTPLPLGQFWHLHATVGVLAGGAP